MLDRHRTSFWPIPNPFSNAPKSGSMGEFVVRPWMRLLAVVLRAAARGAGVRSVGFGAVLVLRAVVLLRSVSVLVLVLVLLVLLQLLRCWY